MLAVQIYDTVPCDNSSRQISYNVFNYGCTNFKFMAVESNIHYPVRGYLLQFSNLYLEQR